MAHNDINNNMSFGYTTNRRNLNIGNTFFYDHNPNVPGSELLFAKIKEKKETDIIVKNL